MYYFKISSQFGSLTGQINAQAELIGLWFDHQKYFPSISNDAIWLNGEKGHGVDAIVYATYRRVKEQLLAYESGTLKTFDLPLNPIATDFRRLVFEELLTIEYGQTTTYGEIGHSVAKKLGKASMSGQAIGGAVGHNPISIVIPCHRVIARDGQLTGYAGGLEKKEALLKHEGLHK